MMNPDELAHALKIFLDMVRSRSATLQDTTTTNTTTTEPPVPRIFLGLNTSIQRLHAHPLPTTTLSLRSTLSRLDLTSLIHHLRISLATGGFTSRFTENPPTPISPHQTTPSLSLDTITDMLTAAVDAIGPSGWISATDDQQQQQQQGGSGLVSDMKLEISAALAGVQEATYLKGILREYLRFTESATKSTTKSNNKGNKSTAVAKTNAPEEEEESSHIRHEKLNGADLLVFTTAGAEEEDGSDKMLPLSLKASSAADVEKTKVKQSTGEVQTRSNREIGYLRRKAVGKYAFERLIV